jgi:uncharacterized protein
LEEGVNEQLESHLALAERFAAASIAGDADAVRACYAPDAEIWHNVDGKVQSVDENLRIAKWVAKNLQGYRQEEVHRVATTEGFVQQHVMRGQNRSGAEVTVPACMVARVKAGRIVRLDEYIDSAHAGVLFA